MLPKKINVMINKFVILAVAALALVACGDDNDPDTPAIVKSKCEVTHTVNVAQDLLEVANVTIFNHRLGLQCR